MNILTPSGYKDVLELEIDDEVVAFDVLTGAPIVNLFKGVEVVNTNTYSRSIVWVNPILINEVIKLEKHDLINCNGFSVLASEVVVGDSILYEGNSIVVDTIIDVEPENTHIPDVLTSYIINGSIELCKYQSIWTDNDIVVKPSMLQVGDTIYDDADQSITITSITTSTLSSWYRLTISGDHSYIADGITLHNASRYWRGGAGTWNAVNTANWSSTSGGAGGSSVPTSADDVTFDSASNATSYAVTFSGATTIGNNISISGPATGTLTITNTSNNLQIFGNFFTSATGVTATNGGSATTTYLATSGTKTITSNGVSMNANFTLNGVGGTFQLVDALFGGNSLGGNSNFTLSNGTFDPNGQTVNSTINNNTSTFTGNWNFFNLTLNPTSIGGLTTFNIVNSLTISNIFNPKGHNATNGRVLVQSSVVGVQRTITCNGSITGDAADFMDINGAGTASWNISAMTNGSGDCGGNTGITFTSATTVTATGTVGFNWTSHSWSGRAFPLPQDTVSIPNAFSAAQTITIDCPRAGANVIFSCSGSPTLNSGFSFGNNVSFFGTLNLTGVGNIASALTHILRGRSSFNLSSPISMRATQIDAPGGTYTFTSSISFIAAFTLVNGSINDNSQSTTITTFACTNTTAGITRSLTMGGAWTSSTNNANLWNVSVGSGMTLNCTGSLTCNYSGATGTRTISNLVASSLSVLNLNITAGTDIVTLGASAIGYLNFTGFAGSWTNTTVSIFSHLTVSTGMTVTAGSNAIILNGTSNQNITSNAKNFNFPITINCVSVTLLDALSIGTSTDRTVTLTSGSLIFNTFNITHFGQFTSTGSTTRSLVMGTNTYDLTSTGAITVFNITGTNFSVTGASTIKISGSTVNIRTFSGGGFTYPTLWYSNATPAGTLAITDSNTFSVIRYIDSTAQSIKFTSSTTNTILSATGFQLNGTSGNLLSFDTVSGSGAFTLSCVANNVVSNYLSVKNCIVTGGSRWFAQVSTNVSGNNGWRFAGASNRQLLIY